MNIKNFNKPLGSKNYGSIGHLPGSRMGPTDSSCPSGQERICNEKVRDKHDLVIVQEKLDGSNVGVVKIDDSIFAITRSGYLASTSKYEQHIKFGEWVEKNKDRFSKVLQNGERIAGEWLLQAHGTKYKLRHEPFVAFDIMQGKSRAIYNEVFDRLRGHFTMPYTVHIGGSLNIEDAMLMLGEFGGHGAIDPIEGAVWRVERNAVVNPGINGERQWKVDFLAKYVRHDKNDGMYLPEVTGLPAVWNEIPA